MKFCVDGKKDVVSADVKVAVVSFQKSPPEMFPYFVVAGLPWNINASNYWGSTILKSCVAATEDVLNTVIIN